MKTLIRSSSSFSNAFSCHLKFYFIFISIYLHLIISNANGFKFNPLIQLPTNEIYRNMSTTSSEILVLNVHDFGAKGDGFTDDTKSLQDVWKVACSSLSRARIIIPARNVYLVQPTDFLGPCQSKVTLRVCGTIMAPYDPESWDGFDARKWLYFHRVKHLKVEGGGTINGMGTKWWARSCKTNVSNPCLHAPTAITFNKCKKLRVRNINIVYSPQMHMAFTRCVGVAASRITIIAPANSPNTDGIHISSSRHVELKNTIISTGDDCISIVGNSSRIRIKDSICGPGHGVSIGSLGKYKSFDAVEDVSVDGAFLFDTKNGVRIKTWQGGRGFVRKITFQNILMKNVSNPIIIDQYYCDSPLPCQNQTSAVKIENVSFRGIRGTSATGEAVVLACSDSYPCKRLYLENIQLSTLYGTEKSFCWEAYGMSSGLIYPPSCISSGEIIIQHNVKSNSTSLKKNDYEFV